MNNGMFMENMVMNFTGCDLQMAKTVIEFILSADKKQNESPFVGNPAGSGGGDYSGTSGGGGFGFMSKGPEMIYKKFQV